MGVRQREDVVDTQQKRKKEISQLRDKISYVNKSDFYPNI